MHPSYRRSVLQLNELRGRLEGNNAASRRATGSDAGGEHHHRRDGLLQNRRAPLQTRPAAGEGETPLRHADVLVSRQKPERGGQRGSVFRVRRTSTTCSRSGRSCGTGTASGTAGRSATLPRCRRRTWRARRRKPSRRSRNCRES